MTRVLIDRHAGFCAGVRRAIRGARRVNACREGARPGVATYGELIHNPQVVGELEGEGIRVIHDVGEARPGERLVIRAHGVPPETERALRERGVPLHDLTCPRVKEIHHTIQAWLREGWRVYIVGDPGHPEVRGHLGYAGEAGGVLSSAGQARECAVDGKVLVLAQTTISPELFHEVVAVLRERATGELRTLDTLCPFVLDRQDWVRRASREAAGEGGATLVIGGRNSSNTRKLAQIAAGQGPVFWIERPEELDLEALLAHPVLALTAGASTPDEAIREVLGRLVARGAPCGGAPVGAGRFKDAPWSCRSPPPRGWRRSTPVRGGGPSGTGGCRAAGSPPPCRG